MSKRLEASTSRLFLLCAALPVLLSWPMLFVSAPTGFFDTIGYYDQGEKGLQMLAGVFIPQDAGETGMANSPSGEPVRLLRAPGWSLYFYLFSQTPLGLVFPLLFQTALCLLVVAAFTLGWQEEPDHVRAVVAIVLCSTLTSLPWMASYAMPDILGAIVIAYFAVLAGRYEGMSPVLRWTMAFVAAFAVMSHYGNIPLAAALAGLTMLVRVVDRGLRFEAVALAAFPIAVAVAINAFAGMAATGEVSAAPKRLPILLARSLEDGPAYWHLREACPDATYAICEILPEIPDRVGGLLWAEDGLQGADAADLERIRDEEAEILWNAFREYPTAQIWSLAGNAARQLVRVGTDDIMRLETEPGTGRPADVESPEDRHAVLGAFDLIVPTVTLASVTLSLFWWATGRLRARDRRVLLLLVGGYLANAVIFGGLSYPVDRYQARVAWLFPVFVALIWTYRRAAYARDEDRAA